ncbi:mitochondrial outer membrane protein porin 4-like [Macadamia integrifolia]|uniref:mitochondrial outer membrane protein porin 4-like n=1 Tax=Macadamia integrifolia TaxID=60698 RepID=UPI001C4EDEAC|nr:mitochondrial outer membrane protein porin 4-like [Macadamia integrifolia]
MANGPAPFPEIGKKAKDLLNKDYNFGHKFTLSMLSDSGMALTATGVKSNQFFLGDISTQYKSGKTTVDVKVDTRSNVSTTITTNEIFPRTRMALNFKIPDHKSGKLDVQYLHPHAAINSSIGLTPTPFLELATTIGTKELSFGGEVGFDTASASFIKCNAGIGLKSLISLLHSYWVTKGIR